MINLSMAEPDNMLRPRITVIGVGGAGGNAINNMIRSNLEGCDFVAGNTDAQALSQSLAGRKIQLGANLSRGLGAGSKPDVGQAAAEESLPDIMSILDGSDMLFVTAGMGGGTGTGAAPVIARAAREAGILTVGVVTKPFHFEGNNRMRQAESGIAELQKYVDTLIVIPNQNLFRIANERTTFAEAFRMADEVLHSGVRGITDLMVMHGFMNLDFADVKTVMGEMGKAMMGTGEADGDNRAIRAAEAAISNPLLDDISMKGARGVLINITGGGDMTLFEVDQAANRIRDEVDPEAQIKVGSTFGEGLAGRIRVSVIATGIDAEHAMASQARRTPAAASAVKPAVRVAPPSAEDKQVASVSPIKPTVTVPAYQAQPAPPKAAYFTMQNAALSKGVESVRDPSSHQRQEAVAPDDVGQDDAGALFDAPERHEESVALTTRSAARGSAPSTVPPMREIPPASPSVQQAERHRTVAASVAPAPVAKDAAASMRITQLTASSSAQDDDVGRSASVNRRAQSLFKRITGIGFVRPSVQDMEDEEIDDAIDDGEVMTVKSSGLDIESSDRPALSNGDSDLLNIPAFLRRQSNR